MVKRKRIALIFSYNEGWIAGSYYIQNLIHALNSLPEDEKPELVILSTILDFEKVTKLNYPFLSHFNTNIKYTFFQKVINKLARVVTGKNVFEKRPSHTLANVFFPMSSEDLFELVQDKQRLFWIPDFQEYHLPHFFTQEQRQNRKSQQELLVKQKVPIVFSSNDSLTDFKTFFPEAQNPAFVLPFAVTHEKYHDTDIHTLKQKYNITKPYYFSPNQFWRHKNHLIVLKAIHRLKEKRDDFQVVFTGKEYDHRNPTYFEELKKFIDDNQLQNYVRFLGFIDRKEQLQLMNHSKAVIQPSLFEGWSTVVEDAKAMNQVVILSDLNVHREQMNYNVVFFDPKNEIDLAQKMEAVPIRSLDKEDDYLNNIKDFGLNFMRIVNKLTSNHEKHI
ncbi:glycosyltransferase family 1 protein [Cytophagaceae bacterium DM2B3-1]|uniref:Glycosyltransferase family 1 protein n=1 Tax=Xanthocytophaga flava TaxID=3048013 RepID=A0ABT7CG39_9BACT|nr:glycosyltransferase family 1 protein [Xanthocytophaga flavus]MDJ1491960.1 glycosyltransferase family 1 protein [Xanthocytophaga flavus]